MGNPKEELKRRLCRSPVSKCLITDICNLAKSQVHAVSGTPLCIVATQRKGKSCFLAIVLEIKLSHQKIATTKVPVIKSIFAAENENGTRQNSRRTNCRIRLTLRRLRFSFPQFYLEIWWEISEEERALGYSPVGRWMAGSGPEWDLEHVSGHRQGRELATKLFVDMPKINQSACSGRNFQIS